jgi:hypothetical protein
MSLSNLRVSNTYCSNSFGKSSSGIFSPHKLVYLFEVPKMRYECRSGFLFGSIAVRPEYSK